MNRTAKLADAYRCAREHVGRFLSERLRLSDIPVSALDRSFIDKFDLYLRTERRLAPNTIVLYMSRLHTVINKAIAAGIITADPFAGYEPPRPERKRRYLTREELRRLMTTQIYAHVTGRKVDEDTKQLRKQSVNRKLELYEEPKAEQLND